MENQNVKQAIILMVFLLGRVKKIIVTLIGWNNKKKREKKTPCDSARGRASLILLRVGGNNAPGLGEEVLLTGVIDLD